MSPRLLVALVLLAAVAHARFHSSQQSPLGAYPARYFTQQLTHFDAIDTRTFQQKFYVNDAYWNAARPRFILYINGEGPVSGPPSNASEVGVLAARHGALIVTLEHRFYGESQVLVG